MWTKCYVWKVYSICLISSITWPSARPQLDFTQAKGGLSYITFYTSHQQQDFYLFHFRWAKSLILKVTNDNFCCNLILLRSHVTCNDPRFWTGVILVCGHSVDIWCSQCSQWTSVCSGSLCVCPDTWKIWGNIITLKCTKSMSCVCISCSMQHKSNSACIIYPTITPT